MNIKICTLTLAIFFSLTASAQYHCIPSLQHHGNPGGNSTVFDDFQGYYFQPSGTAVNTVQWQPIQQIGFPFYFNGALVTSFKATNNGIVTFDTATSVLPKNSNAILPNANIPDKSICICGGRPFDGYTEVQVFSTLGYYQYGGYTPDSFKAQVWITFNCLVDSAARTYHLWSIVLEQYTNNIYIVDQLNSAPANLPLTLGIQVNSTTAYMAPGSPNIKGLAGTSGYSTDNYYYAFVPGASLASDGSVTGTTLPQYLTVNRAPYTVVGLFQNLGTDTVKSLQLHYSINGGTAVTQSFSGLDIATGFTNNLAFTTPYNPASAGNVSLNVWADNLSSGADQDTSDDHFVQPCIVAAALPVRRVMCEEFKGTWCDNSGYWTAQYDTLLRHNFRNATTMHYEEGSMNWTYDRNQISMREYDCYGSGYIPTIFANGAIVQTPDTGDAAGQFPGCPWNLTQGLIDSLSNLPGLFFIEPHLSFKQDSIAVITGTATAAITLPANANCRMYVALVEDTITSVQPFDGGNSNETILYNTDRIMFPSYSSGIHQAPGNNSDTGVFIGHPVAGQIDSFSYTYAISDTSCHTARLHVTVFIQDTLTHEIYQSGESDALFPFSTGLAPRAGFTTQQQRICSGGSLSLQNTSVAGTTYQWSLPGAVQTTSNAQAPSVTYNTPGFYDITLIATNQYGSDTLTQSQFVYVMNTPVSSLNENFESGVLPQNWWTTSNFGYAGWSIWNQSSGYGTGSYSMSSNYVDNFTDTIQQSNLILPEINLASGPHPYLKYDWAFLYISFADGPDMSDSLFILISTDCGTTYQTLYSAGRNDLFTSTLNNDSSEPAPDQWKTHQIDLSAYQGIQDAQIVFRWTQYDYSWRNIYLDNIQIGQQGVVQPKAGFTVAADTVCAGGSVTFQNTSVNSTSYQWLFTGGTPDTSTAVSPKITYASAGSYKVTLIAKNGSATDTLARAVYITAVNKATVPAISQANDTICSGGRGNFSATGSGKLSWYSALTGGTYLAAGNSFQTPVLTTRTMYYVQDSNACGASTRTTATTVVNTTPGIPVNTTPKANDTICAGSRATLSASGSGNISWYSAPTGGTYLASGNTYITPALNAPTTYYAQDSSACGVSSRTAIAVAIGLNTAPPVNTTPAGNSTICAGNKASLSVSGSGSTAWYSASTGGTLLAAGTTFLSPVLYTSTTYYAQDSSACGISARTAVAVTVTAMPASPLNTTPGSSDTVCAGNSTTLTASGADIISWYNALSGGTYLGTGNSFTTPALNETSTFYAQDSNSCGASARTAVLVTVNALPVAPVPTSAVDSVCTGTSASLVVTASGTVGWYDAATAGNYLAGGNTYVTPALNSNTTYYAQDSTACGTSGRTPVSVIISSTTPAPVNTTPAGNDTVCAGDKAALSVSGSSNTTWYSANTGGTLLANGTNFLSPALNIATTYYVQDSSSCGVSARISIAVSVTAIPAVQTITASPDTICNGSTSALSASGTGGVISWYSAASGGAFVSGESTFTTPALDSTTTYYAQDSNNCAAPRQAVTVIVNQGTLPVITQPSPDSLSTTVFSSYSWLLNDTAIENASNQGLAPRQSGPYRVVVVNSAGCGDTSASYNFILNGISPVNAQANITLYPNPNTGTFILETQHALDKTFVIYDILGNEILKQIITGGKQIINLNHASAGIYYLSLQNQGITYTRKIVITAE